MKAKLFLGLLAAASLSILAASARAQKLEDCGLSLRPSAFSPSENDPITLTFLGDVDYCSPVRVAAVGEAALLGLPVPSGALNIILAQRPQNDPGVNCPAVVVPFEIEARLPELLPAVKPPGLIPIGVYRRFEDQHGNRVSQIFCGIVDLSISEGYRSEVPFHDGRFTASVEWTTADQKGSGSAVPADGTATDSALFWFFEPANWELMVKVLDGCAVNDHYWVLGAASTDVSHTLRIADSKTGTVWENTNPGGKLTPAFADVEAFPCDGPK